MDVERIQKINNLALDLLKQGLASNRDDAIAQAEKVFREKSDVSLSGGDMQNNSLQVNSDGSASDRNTRQSKEVSQVDLNQSQIEKILETNTKFLVNKIKEFQEKVENLEKNVSALKRELVKQREENGARAAMPSAPSQAPAQPVAPRPGQHPSGGPATAENPRSGNYEDTDVSIEKFFYAGSK
ncbi:MAG: hypothetical protein ABIG93_01360 [archaeon]|nr:hypothetical protein [Nanoarchaeota archaeon]